MLNTMDIVLLLLLVMNVFFSMLLHSISNDIFDELREEIEELKRKIDYK